MRIFSGNKVLFIYTHCRSLTWRLGHRIVRIQMCAAHVFAFYELIERFEGLGELCDDFTQFVLVNANI